MAALIVLCGLFNIGFAIFHLAFWRLFGWPGTLRTAGTVNSGITQVLNICLTYMFAATGLAILLWRDALASEAGAYLLTAAAGFWALRALLQAPFFGLAHPASRLLLALFVAGAVLHALPVALPGL